MSERIHHNGAGNHLFVRFLRTVIHNPIGIKTLSLSRLLYRPDIKDWVDINQVPVAIPGLPGDFDGYRIVQISDLHLGTWLANKYLLDAVEKINRLKPDLVAITGDFVTYNADRFVDDLGAAVQQLSAKDGILAILGNHDHWTDPGLIQSCLDQHRVTVLTNKVFSIQRGDSILSIAGMDDFMVGKDDLSAILRELPDKGQAVLLVHEPDFADISAMTERFSLQLSGHGHGGQIILPGWGALYLPSHAKRYPAGIYNINGMQLYSNSGLGTAELQFRYRCRPEIAVFSLSSVI